MWVPMPPNANPINYQPIPQFDLLGNCTNPPIQGRDYWIDRAGHYDSFSRFEWLPESLQNGDPFSIRRYDHLSFYFNRSRITFNAQGLATNWQDHGTDINYLPVYDVNTAPPLCPRPIFYCHATFQAACLNGQEYNPHVDPNARTVRTTHSNEDTSRGWARGSAQTVKHFKIETMDSYTFEDYIAAIDKYAENLGLCDKPVEKL